MRRPSFAHRLADGRRAEQPPHGRGRDALVHAAGDALLRVDLPARPAVEPPALHQREAALVARPLEARLDDDRVAADQLQVEARLHRLLREAELHQRRLEQDALPLEHREQLGHVLPPHVDRGVPRVAALEARQQAEGVAVGRGVEGLPGKRDRGQHGHARLGVEHRHGERTLPDVETELHAPRPLQNPLGWEPRPDARLLRRRIRRGDDARAAQSSHTAADAGWGRGPTRPRGWRRRLHLLRRPTPVPPAHPLQRVPARVRGLREHRGERRLAPRRGRAGLVPDADEQRRDVLAVLPALGEGRAGALGLDAIRRKLDADRVGLRVAGPHGAARRHVVDGDVLHDLAAEVLQAAEERSGAEQAAEAAVAQGGQGIGDLGHGLLPGHALRARLDPVRSAPWRPAGWCRGPLPGGPQDDVAVRSLAARRMARS